MNKTIMFLCGVLSLILFTGIVSGQEGGGIGPFLPNESEGGGAPANETTPSNITFYDPEILEAFNNLTPRFGVKIINNQTWILVIVDLRDNSNITVIGTTEERRALSRQKDEWFQPVINEVLSTLSEDEFDDIRTSLRSFSGHISKKGFNKLVNDPRITAIHMDKPVYAVGSGVGIGIPTETENVTVSDEGFLAENISVTEPEVEIVENISEVVEIEEAPPSVWSRFVQFLKSLFGFG